MNVIPKSVWFLPIVVRELSVASRRKGTYRLRLFVALTATVIAVCIHLAYLGIPSHELGPIVFRGLAVLLLVYALGSGRLSTADCLSSEKREGTLGLLFLTDLSGYDVVLGKMAATSLSSFYGMLAVFPVLALPLLLGGTTNGEFWRMLLVLLNTFLLSLSIGIFASAISRDGRRAMGVNFLLLLLLLLGAPACAMTLAYAIKLNEFPHLFFYTCSIYSFVLSFDVFYKMFPVHFWVSFVIQLGFSFMFIVLAAKIAPHSWQDAPAATAKAGTSWRERWHAWSFGSAAGRARFRKRLLDINAFYWLAARARLKPLHVWVFLLMMGVWWLIGWSLAGRFWLDPATLFVLAGLLNTGIKLWVAVESAQRLAEDRHSGSLELLLSTPITAGDILRGQFMALRRQFLQPLAAIAVLELCLMWISRDPLSPAGRTNLCVWLAGICLLFVDSFAIAWAGIAAGLTAKSPNHATASAIIRIMILPWLLYGAVLLAVQVVSWFSSGMPPELGWKFYLGCWFVIGLFVDAVFGGVAWFQLRNGFRQRAARQFVHTVSQPSTP